MAGVHDAIKAWRQAWLDDTTLAGLLATQTSPLKSIMFDGHGHAFRRPWILLAGGPLNPQLDAASITGIWRPVLTVQIIADDPNTCDAINNHLVETWTIPMRRLAPVTTTGFSIGVAQQVTEMSAVAYRETESGEQAYMKATEWKLRITRQAV